MTLLCRSEQEVISRVSGQVRDNKDILSLSAWLGWSQIKDYNETIHEVKQEDSSQPTNYLVQQSHPGVSQG